MHKETETDSESVLISVWSKVDKVKTKSFISNEEHWLIHIWQTATWNDSYLCCVV